MPLDCLYFLFLFLCSFILLFFCSFVLLFPGLLFLSLILKSLFSFFLLYSSRMAIDGQNTDYAAQWTRTAARHATASRLQCTMSARLHRITRCVLARSGGCRASARLSCASSARHEREIESSGVCLDCAGSSRLLEYNFVFGLPFHHPAIRVVLVLLRAEVGKRGDRRKKRVNNNQLWADNNLALVCTFLDYRDCCVIKLE